jgi:hypothetical protein
MPSDGMQTDAGSVALWVRPRDTSGFQYLFSHTIGGAQRISIYTILGKITVGMGDQINVYQSTEILDPGLDYHMTLTWDNGTYALYLDGAKIAEGAYANLDTLDTTALIGNYNSPTFGFKGIIDDVKVYKRALTNEDVIALYNTHDIKENRYLELVINGTDELGNPLAYTPANLPTGAVFDPATQTLIWKPWYNQAGEYRIDFQADQQPAETVTISVQDMQMQDWYQQFLQQNGAL